jgi:hypothetical protein
MLEALIGNGSSLMKLQRLQILSRENCECPLSFIVLLAEKLD